jgi:hypothetical protein
MAIRPRNGISSDRHETTMQWVGRAFVPAAGFQAGFGRGRDAGYPTPPAQIRAGAPNAHGSYLGCVLTQSEPPGTDAESRLPGSSSRVCPESASRSSGCVDSAGEVATTTCAALRSGTPSVAPRSGVQRDIGSIHEPPIAATSSCPWSSRASLVTTSAAPLSAWLPSACRSSSGTP